MANQRDIKNRIKSITNTKKITGTMEMVSSAKMKKLQKRMELAKPYSNKINEIIANLRVSGAEVSHDLHFNEVTNPTRVIVLQITGNRGLCGSYNSNVIDNTLELKKKNDQYGIETLVYSVGKKGQSFLDFIKVPLYKSIQNFEDKLTFENAATIGEELRRMFITGEVHEVYVSYTEVISFSKQQAKMVKILPISEDFDETMSEDSLDFNVNYYFEPNPIKIFSYILPLYIKVKLFACMIESSYSEQFSRMVSMKNATDASGEMIDELTVTYNRVRQAKITNEIAEIVGGAAALE